jgi:hypothetical protein
VYPREYPAASSGSAVEARERARKCRRQLRLPQKHSRHRRRGRYLAFLIYWYRSTDTDADGAATMHRCRAKLGPAPRRLRQYLYLGTSKARKNTDAGRGSNAPLLRELEPCASDFRPHEALCFGDVGR